MRKLLIAAMAASMLVPVTAGAQGNREARHDQREYRQDHNQRYADARQDRRDVRRDRRDVRQDRRDDWRSYRERNREVYRRPAYSGPRGYRYRPVAVGHRFARPYYASRYWIPDYARYRLPPPGYGHRWVRYGNDVVLINIRNGRVLQVFASFFW